MNQLLPWIILVPFAASVLCFLTPRRLAELIGLSSGVITAFLCIGIVRELLRQGVQTYVLGGWPTPLGIALYIDGLSAVHLIMTTVVGLFVSLYARSYFHHEAHHGVRFWPIWLFMWGTLNALYLSADLFNLYVVLELLGLSAVALVALTGTARVTAAALRYLLAAMAGSMTYLLGVAFLYATYSVLDMPALSTLVQSSPVTAMALALMVFGLIMKTALFPLHFWLPPAHAGSSAPASAILSALVVKASFYIILRLWFTLFPEVVTFSSGQMLGALGACAIVWGSIQALRQQRLKLLVAHSTVAQLGYLFLVFPIATAAPLIDGIVDPSVLEAAKGVMYHALSHGLAKASLFLSAGILLHAAGSDQLSHLRGAAERLPVTVFAMALAGISLMGLPPSGGFIAKWLLLHASLQSGQWWWAPVIMAGGLMTAGYIFAMLRNAFLPGDASAPHRPVSMVMQGSALALAVISTVIGLRASDVMDLLMIGNPFSPGGMP